MTSNKHMALGKCLNELQTSMQEAGLWSNDVPSQQALNSHEPFCIDTLRFEQWLQFVMLMRFEHMIQQALPLPTNSDMNAMAQEAFKGAAQAKVVAAIQAIDAVLTGH